MDLYCMCDSFFIKLIESNYIRYEGDNDPFCGISITASDGTTSFTFDGLGLHKSHLQSIISEIDNTLAGKHNQDFRLQFADPNIIGGDCHSPISFFIHCGKTHDEDYWEFIYEGNGGWHNSGKTKYSICFCTDDLKNLREELETQINNFNWSEHGKIDYYEIDLPEKDYITAYSAAELKGALLKLLTGKRLKKMFVDLHGHIGSKQYDDNSISFSYMGGPDLLVFDDIAVELCIHGEGMIRYRVFDNFDAGCMVKKRGYAPEDSYTKTSYFFDLATVLALQFEDTALKTIEITPTDMWPFSQSWFDEEKANASNDLPNIIKFHMSNDVQICFAGDSIEYYYMYLEQC